MFDFADRHELIEFKLIVEGMFPQNGKFELKDYISPKFKLNQCFVVQDIQPPQ